MAVGLTPAIIADESHASSRFAQRCALRKALIERRRGLSAEDCVRFSSRICALLQAAFPEFSGMRVAFCWPFKQEPDLRPLVESWLRAGKKGFTALLPVVIDQHRALAFRAWSPDTVMLADRYGIPVPAAGEFLIPEVVLIPVNGFDAAGYRIGYGGGYFDRTLASVSPRPLAVGVGFELARLDSICPEPHDQRLDVMVTEAGVFRPSS
ncbi:5-formyltetrahydrofolate cyclo-ligase [Accumulibacter sp.]|uniref:5-formyltetrahydrofolate cyclo-ligase n=1 Tax=Accumulibacter sp. TaxID=2053492 RepID=UPI002CBD51C4|nr:5-formyltetrahydrofolate cyclo-ligase [Accumulibacter sp.]HPU79309.1 5-formyltetrahydrofolate cyclo-ligase [Accumulibacter sp.]